MTRHEPHDGLDARARAVHAAALEHLSPRVQAQLAQRRRAALQGTPARAARSLLPWAGIATAGLALALVVQLKPPSAPPAARTVSASASDAPGRLPATAPRVAALDPADAPRATPDAEAIAPDLSEDPEFYLWLGDASPARPE